MSGCTCSVQPGSAVANTVASGSDAVAKPSTTATSALVGNPLASARHVLPVHGSDDVTVSPAQPAPCDSESAGQVVVSRARLGDGRPPAVTMAPPTSRSPSGNAVTAYTPG